MSHQHLAVRCFALRTHTHAHTHAHTETFGTYAMTSYVYDLERHLGSQCASLFSGRVWRFRPPRTQNQRAPKVFACRMHTHKVHERAEGDVGSVSPCFFLFPCPFSLVALSLSLFLSLTHSLEVTSRPSGGDASLKVEKEVEARLRGVTRRMNGRSAAETKALALGSK